MKKMSALIAALAIATLFAFTGCQKQEEKQQEGQQPGSAPTATEPSSPGTK
jgi:hypothetical protein